MTVVVRATVCPDQVLEEAGAFLASDPVAHNLILTLLRSRMACPEPGRYWVVEIDARTSGVVFRSPLHFIATVTPMGAQAVTAAVEAIADEGVSLPGVSGQAATAALFAGHWSEKIKSPVHPVQAQRIYEAVRVVPPRDANGTLRQATSDDRDLLVEWLQAFHAEIGESVGDPAQVVPRRLRAGQLWLWDDHGPAAMAGLSDAVAEVVRVGPVYTPAARRNCGYASALVAGISSAARTRGERPILYTDLGNPTSNSIYRAIGYHAVVEILRYRFGRAP